MKQKVKNDNKDSLKIAEYCCDNWYRIKKYENSTYDPDDLISIGTIGLVKAIDSYKLNKKVKLTTYAARCIENEILMHLRSNKKHLNNVSLNDSVGFDKDGNEINLIDVIKIENKDINVLRNIKKMVLNNTFGNVIIEQAMIMDQNMLYINDNE